MSDPNLDFVQPTNAIETEEICGTEQPTLNIIVWEPDGRTIEQTVFDDVVFSIEISVL